MTTTDGILQVDLETARPYAGSATPLSDCFAIESLTSSTFSGTALRLGLALMCYCQEGEARFRRSGREGRLGAGDLLLEFGGQLIEPLHTSDDFRGFAIVASHEFVGESLAGLRHLWPYLLRLLEEPVIHLEEDEYARLWNVYLFAREHTEGSSSRFLRETAVAVLRIALFDIADLLTDRFGPAPAGDSRAYGLFGDFMRLAGENFRRHRGTEWYAERLCVSAKHLSAAVKSVSGRTASEWTAGMTLAEAQNLLRTTDKSAKEISSALGFSSQSLFGVFFRKGTGLTPGEYRRKASR